MKYKLLLYFITLNSIIYAQKKYFVAQKADNKYFVEVLSQYDSNYKPDIIETIADMREFVIIPGFFKKGYNNKSYRQVFLYGKTTGYVNAEEIKIIGNNFVYKTINEYVINNKPDNYFLEESILNKESVKINLSEKFISSLKTVKNSKGKYFIVFEIKGKTGAFVQAGMGGASLILPNTLSYGKPWVSFLDYKGRYIDAVENTSNIKDYQAKGVFQISKHISSEIINWNELVMQSQQIGIGKIEQINPGIINLSKYVEKMIYWSSYTSTNNKKEPKAKSIQIIVPVSGNKITKQITPQTIKFIVGLSIFPEKSTNYSYRTIIINNIPTEKDSLFLIDWVGVNKKQLKYYSSQSENELISLKGTFTGFWPEEGVESFAALFKTQKGKEYVITIGLAEQLRNKDTTGIWIGDTKPFEYYLTTREKLENNSDASNLEENYFIEILALKKSNDNNKEYYLLGIKSDKHNESNNTFNLIGTYSSTKDIQLDQDRSSFYIFSTKEGELISEKSVRDNQEEILYKTSIDNCYFIDNGNGEREFFIFGKNAEGKKYVDISNGNSSTCSYIRYFYKEKI